LTSSARTAETAEAAPAPAPARVRPAPQAVPPAAAALAAVASAQEGAAAHARAHARPWWFDAPAVAMGCARVAAAPFVAVVRVAEAAVAVALLAALATAFAWHQGYVTDKDVVAALKPVGQRVLAMVQSAGDR